MNWQPISTAPSDGTKVIVRGNLNGHDWVAISAWESTGGLNGEHWIVYEYGRYKETEGGHGGGYAVTCRPTHWVPL